MSAGPVILIVDDDREVRASAADYLTLHGFTVLAADGGVAMRERLAEQTPDLVILDLNMPGESGLQLAQWLRARGETPILMLTALDEPIDRIVGLEMGADDYMGKPYHPRELVARIRTILRRSAPPPPPPSAPGEVRFGLSLFDRAASRLTGPDGVSHQLTGMECDLLAAFAAHPGQVLSRERLLELAHDRDAEPFDRSIDVRVSRIRRKLVAGPDNPQVIRTVRNMGYIFEPQGRGRGRG